VVGIEELSGPARGARGGVQRFGSLIIKLFLMAGLGGAAWYATFDGMLQLIEANFGSLDFKTKVAIGFTVSLLTLMIIFILNEFFKPKPVWQFLLCIAGYILLLLISVGFGFGFFWKLINSKVVATEEASAAITQVQSALVQGQTRLELVQQSLQQLAEISSRKAREERLVGGTCPDNNDADEGPRQRMRDKDAKDFGDDAMLIGSRIETVKQGIGDLSPDLKLIQTGVDKDPKTGRSLLDADGTRNSFLRSVESKVSSTAASYEALRTDPTLDELKKRFEERANKEAFMDRGTTFRCPDDRLKTDLLGAARAIGELPAIHNPGIKAMEGSEATIQAFQRLTTTFLALVTTFKLPPSPEELKKRRIEASGLASQGKTQPDEEEDQPGMSKRDLIPLMAAIGVDFCLFLIAMLKPFDSFGQLKSEVMEQEHGQIAEAFRKILESSNEYPYEFYRNHVFKHWGDFYVAIPRNLTTDKANRVAVAFAAMEGLRFMEEIPVTFHMRLQAKLKAQGSAFSDERDFIVYRMHINVMPRMLRDLLLSEAAEGHGAKHEEKAPLAILSKK
jgi:hypothetical protein